MNNLRQWLVMAQLLLAALSSSPACAQMSAPAPKARYRLEGTVVNRITGQPIPRALVRLSGIGSRAVLSGAEGEFSFADVPEGSVDVNATKPGYFRPGTGYRTYRRWQRPIDMGPDTGKLMLKLVPEAVVSGQVLGKDDEPVEGVFVDLLAAQTLNGQKEIFSLALRGFVPGSTGTPIKTDEDGNFRVGGLVPGTYYVVLKSADSIRATATTLNSAGYDGTHAYPPVLYYPGVTDFGSATPLELSSGQHLSLNFALKLVPTFKVTGTVRRQPELRLVNPPFIVDEADQQIVGPEEYDNDTGAFEFKALPAGTYAVRLSGIEQSGNFLSSVHTLTVDGSIRGLSLNLGTPQDIPVIVHKSFSGPPIPGHCESSGLDGKVRISDCSSFPIVTVQLRGGGGRISASTTYAPQADPDAIALRRAMPGRYSVIARPFGQGYVQALRSGSVDLLRDELIVPDEGSVPPIEVTLRDDGAALKLRVKADGPTKSGWAVVVPDLLSRDAVVLDVHTGTDRDYSGLPPGDYQVFAIDSVAEIDPADRESLEKFAGKATRITLTAHSSTTVLLDLLRTGE
jgi:Carboxypeptidase regulatory-like domain